MGRKAKGKHRLDKYYHWAQEQGYRSRASCKLIQLDEKFSLLSSAHAVLDLCAAPGGWMQVAVKRVPVGSLILGLDLDPIAPIKGAIALQQDITKSECKVKIKRVMDEHGVRAFDLILHDGSPNVGGAWSQEAMTQSSLVIDSVKLATQFLAPKGKFVTKVFRSQDYSSVLYCLKQLFGKVEVNKPPASRSSSAEIYVLGFNYKAPSKIDPRLLDVKHLFQGAIEPPKVIDVLGLAKNSQKRNRTGYEDGLTLIRKASSAGNFIWSDSPLEILGSVTTIVFGDPDSVPIRDHELTTQEVKALCEDLQVLTKQDFKQLLKWRLQIRKALSPEKVIPAITDVEKDGKGKEEEDGEDKLLNEMEELTYAMERKKKRAKKLIAKRKAKDKARKATGMHVDVMQDEYVDAELFSLSAIKGKKDLVTVDTTEQDGENGDLGGSDAEENKGDSEDDSSGDIDSEEERRRHDERVEEILDQAYEQYRAKTDGSTKQRKRAKQSYSEKLEDGDGEDTVLSDQDSDKEQGDLEANPLVVSLEDGEGPTQEEITNQWFGQDMFVEAAEEGDLGTYKSEDEMLVDSEEKGAPEKERMKSSQAAAPATKKAKDSATGPLLQAKVSKPDDDFEIVPAPATDSSDSSSDESEDLDINEKAEILAYAKKMLRKKPREQLLDDAYNKYMFHDDGLPKWFLDEEMKHRQPTKPITKEEVAAMRAQFKEINARPAKKVAQAKARKKRVAMRKLEQIRKKANSISDQADIPDRSKGKLIEQLYKKATPKRPEREYVVAKKGVQVRTGKGKVLVDPRMKKDTRGRGSVKSGKGGSKKGKNGKMQKGKGPMKGSVNKKGGGKGRNMGRAG